MPIDPDIPRDREPAARTAQRLADLERDLRQLRQGTARVQHGSGPPPAGAREPYVDDAASRLYFVVAGAWRSVALS